MLGAATRRGAWRTSSHCCHRPLGIFLSLQLGLVSGSWPIGHPVHLDHDELGLPHCSRLWESLFVTSLAFRGVF